MADQQQQEEEGRVVVEDEEEEEQQQQQQQQQQQEVSLSVCSDSAGADVDVDVDGDGDNNSTNKAARLPRWTRQEILVLIQGKKVAENRVRRGRAAGSCVEPKWATVSSYCKRHGVNRGAVQCRKRWSNLAGDFKKIKEWESHIKDDSDSFWLMRNDIRRDRKLPGFFDREVYDILDLQKDHQQPLSPPPPPPSLLFDSGRNAPPDDALFSDFDDNKHLPLSIPFPAPTPISAKQYHPPLVPDPTPTGVDDEKHAASNPEIGSTSQNERKRKRSLVEDDTSGAASLLQIIEKNGRNLSAQLEAYNINLKLDREDRKDHANSVVAVLNKVADGLARIADKL